MSFASDCRTVVAHQDFRKLYCTRLSAQAADGMFQVALASYVFFAPQHQASPTAAAATAATLLLPYTFVGPFAGVLLDRWRRRQVLVRANLVRATLLGAIALIVWAGITGPLLFGTALVALSINRFFLAAVGASLPQVVVRNELIMANSVCMTSGSMAALFGGGLGLAVHQVMAGGRGTDAALMLLAAGGYLASSMLAGRMHPDLLGPNTASDAIEQPRATRPSEERARSVSEQYRGTSEERERAIDTAPPALPVRQALGGVLRGLGAGAAHIWARPAARNALAVLAAQRFCYGTGTIAMLLLYRNYFNEPGSEDAAMRGLGAAFAAAGAGYFVAAMITPEMSRRLGKPVWMIVALGCASVFGFALVAPYEPPPLVLGAFLLGIAAQVVKICVDTTVQESIIDAYRGRVFAFSDMLFNLSFVAAAAVAALTMPESGKSYAILTAVSAGYALAALLYLRAHLRTRPAALPSPPHAHPAPATVRVSAR